MTKTPTKKRARAMEDVRSTITGTSKQSEHSDTQIAVEWKRVPTSRRNKICSKAGVKQKLKVSGEQTLVMKEEQGMSWGQERKLGKLLKDLGIQLQNEHYVRDLLKS